MAKREARSPVIREAKVVPAEASTAKTGDAGGAGTAGERAVERVEAQPSEIDDETPTASWPFFGRVPPFKVLWHINTHALIALNAKTGKVDWKRDLNAHLESSPLIVGRTLNIGTDSKQVLAIDTANGHKLWEYKANAAIKASPSFHDGLIYVGNYQSGMLPLHARTGKLAWQTNTTEEAGGRGGFYSSPAIAFGHVYTARDDGRRLRLRPQDRQGRLVLPDRRLRLRLTRGGEGAGYARDRLHRLRKRPPLRPPREQRPRTLARRRRRPDPGTASVIGNTVFSSSFKTRESVGYDVHSHKRDFTLHSAGYSPVVSDGHHLYVAGYYTFYGLEEMPGTR